MRLIDLDAIMAQFPKADFYGDAIENMKAYPYWKTDITGLINILEDVPIIEQSEDCISRAAIYEALSEWDEQDVYLPYHFKELVAELPSVTPQQKVGKWINKGDYAECSNCGANSGVQYNGVEPVPLSTRYCPNCGAKMEDEKVVEEKAHKLGFQKIVTCAECIHGEVYGNNGLMYRCDLYEMAADDDFWCKDGERREG